MIFKFFLLSFYFSCLKLKNLILPFKYNAKSKDVKREEGQSKLNRSWASLRQGNFILTNLCMSFYSEVFRLNTRIALSFKAQLILFDRLVLNDLNQRSFQPMTKENCA